MLLKKGDSGTNVTYLQYGLRIMNCYSGSVDGKFGDGTYTAVRKFQSNYKLSVDGIVGDGTWNKLKSEIIPIQNALNSKGYSVGSADGIAGSNTYNAVLRFQKANGLTADGLVGPATRKILLREYYLTKMRPFAQALGFGTFEVGLDSPKSLTVGNITIKIQMALSKIVDRGSGGFIISNGGASVSLTGIVNPGYVTVARDQLNKLATTVGNGFVSCSISGSSVIFGIEKDLSGGVTGYIRVVITTNRKYNTPEASKPSTLQIIGYGALAFVLTLLGARVFRGWGGETIPYGLSPNILA